MAPPRFVRLLLAGLALLLAVVPGGTRPANAAVLNPPIPGNATDVHCNDNGNGTVCQYRTTASGGLFPFFGPGVPCPSGFEVLVESFQNQGRVTRFYDAAGQLTREIRHIEFTGYVSNSQTGKHIFYEGRFTRTYDPQAQTITFTGQRFKLHLDDGRVVVLDAGRTVFDETTDPEVFKAGPGGTEENLRTLCALLA